MKRAGLRRRKVLAVLGVAFAVLAVVVATLPWWLPWVVSPVLKQYGIRFTDYKAHGWTRFTLRGVRADYEDAVVEAARVEGPSPFVWLLSRFRGDGSAAMSISGADWRVRVIDDGTSPPTKPSATDSTAEVIDDLSAVLASLRQWLPTARLTTGVVEVGSDRLNLPTAEWAAGQLKATVRSPRFTAGHLVELYGDFTAETAWTVSGSAESADAEARVELTRTNGNWHLAGGGEWRSNKVDLTARFEPNGWWPNEARLTVPSMRLPAGVLAWDGYDDITGSAFLHWTGSEFDLDVAAVGKPSPDAPKGLPRVDLKMRGSGTLDAVFVEALQLTGPGLRADLSERIGITRSGQMLTDGATLKLSLDLARLPWISMTGNLRGTVRLRPGGTNQPRAAFELSSTDLTHAKLAFKEATLAGEFNGPLLALRQADATLADGSIFSASVRVDLKGQIARDGRWKFRGRLPDFLAPAGVAYTELQTEGEFGGPLSRLQHSGRLTAEKVTVAPLDPFGLNSTWRGEALTLSQVEAQLNAGRSRLMVGGAVTIGESAGASNHVSLRRLTFDRDGTMLYALKQPCELAFQADVRRPGEWLARLTPLEWAGDGREIILAGEVAWPRQGAVRARLNGVSIDDFTDFVSRPLPASCLISNLQLNASWDEGPILFDLTGSARLATHDGTPFAARARIRGDDSGLRIERTMISGTAGDVMTMEGSLPVAVIPGLANDGWLRWDEKKSIDIHASTAVNERFWDGVAAMTGARFAKPEMTLTIQGTLAQPRGILRARAERLAWEPSTNRVTPPTLENLEADAEFQRDRIELKALTVELEGQPVRARGELPLGKTFWPDLVAKGGLPDWRAARGQFEIVDARLELFARYLPELLSPQGRLSLEVALQPGAKLDGLLEITNAATRPLMPIGRVHDIEAQVRFRDRVATIETFRGELGGQPVRVTGSASLVEKGALEFEAVLRGTNVPLIREAGVLLRSDLNLRLVQKIGQPTLVSGEATLRNGLFLQDLKSLVPTGPSRQSRRPPYFSVEEPPFADWRLDVRIKGDRSLQVRTPLFRGDISTALQLSGSMKEPVALGEVSIFGGRMQFPFGTLEVDRGYVSLTSENPYQPELFVTASGYTYGYSIKMEVTGPADEPRMTFTSTPPLTSEQIVLMLTAGELPREDFVLSDQQRVARLGMFLGRDFLGRILGSDGGAERLTIRSGEYMTDQGEQTYYLEYRLTDDWSVVGEYDRFNALNAGLKWKIFSK